MRNRALIQKPIFYTRYACIFYILYGVCVKDVHEDRSLSVFMKINLFFLLFVCGLMISRASLAAAKDGRWGRSFWDKRNPLIYFWLL